MRGGCAAPPGVGLASAVLAGSSPQLSADPLNSVPPPTHPQVQAVGYHGIDNEWLQWLEEELAAEQQHLKGGEAGNG